jgi:hypothetical protein
LNTVVFKFAILVAITSSFVYNACMPVAAV